MINISSMSIQIIDNGNFSVSSSSLVILLCSSIFRQLCVARSILRIHTYYQALHAKIVRRMKKLAGELDGRLASQLARPFPYSLLLVAATACRRRRHYRPFRSLSLPGEFSSHLQTEKETGGGKKRTPRSLATTSSRVVLAMQPASTSTRSTSISTIYYYLYSYSKTCM